ncbi:MAG: hypothetical protein P1V18_05125 [Candidatus Gracilibacteria bacterium]|nr:hypothetical protein [Candidatus Gracilibacteria bacterium]
MNKKAQRSGLTFVSMILILTVLIIMASSMHIWFVVPEETALQINGKQKSISTDVLLGTILETTLKEEN